MAHAAAVTRLSSASATPPSRTHVFVVEGVLQVYSLTPNPSAFKNPAMFGAHESPSVCERCLWIARPEFWKLLEWSNWSLQKFFGTATSTDSASQLYAAMHAPKPKWAIRSRGPSSIAHLCAQWWSSDGPAWRKQSPGVGQCHACLANTKINLS